MTAKAQVRKLDSQAACRFLRKRGEDGHIFIVTYRYWNNRLRETCGHKSARAAWQEALTDLRTPPEE